MNIKEEFALMSQRADHDEAAENTIKTVSLRLEADVLANVDIIAEEVKMTRQAVLEKFVMDSLCSALIGVIEGKTDGLDAKARKAYVTKLNERCIEKFVTSCADGGVKVQYTGILLRASYDEVTK